MSLRALLSTVRSPFVGLEQRYMETVLSDIQNVADGSSQRLRVREAATSVTAALDDVMIFFTDFSVPRVLTLPSASLFGLGSLLHVVPFSDDCDTTNTLTVTCAGSDKIHTPGQPSGVTSVLVTSPWLWIGLLSDGVSKWIVRGPSWSDI